MTYFLKVECLAPYPVENAAVRYRVLQYFPYLSSDNIKMSFRPFLYSGQFARFYASGHTVQKASWILISTLRRFLDVLRSFHADAVLIHREAAFIGPPLFEFLIARLLKKPIVFDFDDAVHILQANTPNQRLAVLLKSPGKTPQTIHMARAIIAGNAHLARYARTLNPCVTEIPTVVDAEKVRPAPAKDRAERTSPVILGWIGTPSNYPYLESIFPVLQELAKCHRFVLRAVGAGREITLPGVTVDNRPWSLKSELELLQSFDIGLYPMIETPWSLGKSGFKAIEYMAVGIPVVGNPVGTVCDIMQDGVHGFLPLTLELMVEALGHLINDASLRRTMGAAGRERVEDWYCLAKQAPRFCNVIREAAG